jgi:hypothetical protein
MNITYNWSIQSMSCLNECDGNSNVVTTITYNVVATDLDTSVTVPFFGTINTHTLQTGKDFIPFENLTEETVIEWTQAILGEQVQKIKDAMSYNLLIKQNAPVAVTTLPWATSPAP